MRQKPRITARKTLARTRFFHIESVSLCFSNGAMADYERLISSDSGGAVLVVPLLNEETVLMIREYAAGVDRYELALPKGLVEAGENVLEAANREMMEEVGYGARHLECVRDLTVAPGYSGFVTHVVLARQLYPQRMPGDEPEEIEVVPWSLSRLSELLAQPDCTEARSIAALFMVRERLSPGR